MSERIRVTERDPDPGQQWKCGDEFLPFHPAASHVPPDYRDGWNRCYWMAMDRIKPAESRAKEDAKP
jgi:hypothetical protein